MKPNKNTHSLHKFKTTPTRCKIFRNPNQWIIANTPSILIINKSETLIRENKIKTKPLAGVLERRERTFEIRVADPPRVLVRHLELHLVPGPHHLLLLLLRICGARVLHIGDRVRARVRVRVRDRVWSRFIRRFTRYVFLGHGREESLVSHITAYFFTSQWKGGADTSGLFGHETQNEGQIGKLIQPSNSFMI